MVMEQKMTIRVTERIDLVEEQEEGGDVLSAALCSVFPATALALSVLLVDLLSSQHLLSVSPSQENDVSRTMVEITAWNTLQLLNPTATSGVTAWPITSGREDQQTSRVLQVSEGKKEVLVSRESSIIMMKLKRQIPSSPVFETIMIRT